MKPVGTFLDFTRLYVYVHWMFFHFFVVDEILAKSTILPNCAGIVHLWTSGWILNTLDILVSGFCFYTVH